MINSYRGEKVWVGVFDQVLSQVCNDLSEQIINSNKVNRQIWFDAKNKIKDQVYQVNEIGNRVCDKLHEYSK